MKFSKLAATFGAMMAMSFAAPASATVVVSDAITATTSGFDLDFWGINVTSAGNLTIDMRSEYGPIDINGDGFAQFFDIFITLARDDGNLTADDIIIQSDDHGGVIDGSIHGYDSFFDVFVNPGSYIFIVANCCDFGGGDILDGNQYGGQDVTGYYVSGGAYGDGSTERGYQITAYGSATYTIAGLLNVGAAPVPAPGAIALLGFGLLGLGAVRRRRKA